MNSATLFLIGAPIAIVYFWYASIISKQNAVQEAFSGIDVQLKKRTDLIPNILKIAKKFMDHESKVMTEITALRTQVMEASKKTDPVSVQNRFNLESQLEQKLGGLMVQVENYPELKSQENMIEAQRVYADVEEHISAARRSYNAATTSLRNSIQIFPGNLIAKAMNVQPTAYFKIPEADKAPVHADDFLN